MPVATRYLFIASMDVEPGKETLMSEVYDQDHLPSIASVPGVRSVTRFQRRDLSLIIGGELRTVKLENEPISTVLYEIDAPEVLVSDEWARRVEAGRWPSEVRPFTKNRRHVLLERAYQRP